MFIDSRKIDNQSVIDTDICIIGSGAAGIALAVEFDGGPQKVIVLEGAGFIRSKTSQALYEGEVVGLNYELSTSRDRHYGGSTNSWGGYCRPLKEFDFSARDWTENSGWPLNYHELNPFYKRACTLCNTRHDAYDPEKWLKEIDKKHLKLFPFSGGRIETEIYQRTPTRKLGKEYRRQLNKSSNVTIYLHANAKKFRVSENASEVSHVDVATLSGREFSVRARTFILATGGIENARLLLLSDDVMKEGLGNQNDLVGRYFMEHPQVYSGILKFNKPFNPDFYDISYTYFQIPVMAGLSLSTKTMREEKLLGYKAYIEAVIQGEDSPGIRNFRDMYLDFRKQEIPKNLLKKIWSSAKEIPGIYKFILGKRLRYRKYFSHYRLNNIIEPTPNKDSRVSLNHSTDVLGLRKVKLDWKLSPLVQKTLLRAHQIIDEEMRKSNLGYLEIDPVLEQGGIPEPITWVWHHMGTTRMDPAPKKGVVDTDCRVHGVSNLYVAGSSVFPTVGNDAPTLTLIALAIKLADHLKNQF